MRDQRIDFIKGMLMWCVVYGHTVDALFGGNPYPPVWLHVFVRTFDLPFFMILSGYFLKKSLENRGVWNVALNRITMIFIPIVIWTLLRGSANVCGGMYYFLWAVLVSGMMCVLGYFMASFFPSAIGKWVEAVLYLLILIVLYSVSLPWNLFYLYPFFVVGYYLRNVNFAFRRLATAAVMVIMAVGLCFWSPDYTPWNIGALAWKSDFSAFYVYVYRFLLALSGVYLMLTVFDAFYAYLGSDSIFVRQVTDVGRETLAIYILQAIFVERVLRYGCRIVWGYFSFMNASPVLNLVGYVIAPIISFFLLVCLDAISRKIKSYSLLQFAFGFKAR